MADNILNVIISAVDQTAAALASVNRKLDGIKSAAAAVGLSLSALGAVAGLASLAKQSIDAADNLNDLSQSLGLSIQQLAAYKLLSEQSGVSLEAVGKGIKGLSGNMAQYGDALRAAGITAKDADGAMRQIADVFEKMPDGIEKTALASKLFGRAGMELIPMLNMGSKGLDEAAEKSAKYAATMAALGPQADKFNDNMAELALHGQLLGTSLANEVLPGLIAITTAMSASAKEGNNFLQVGGAISTVFETLVVLGANTGYVFKQVGNEIGGIGAQLMALARGDFEGFSNISKMMKEDAERARKEIDAFNELILNPQKALDAAKPKAPDTSGVQAWVAEYKKLMAAMGLGASEVDKAIKASNDYIASLEKETAAIGKNVYEKKYLEAATKMQAAATQAQRDAIMQGFSAWSEATQLEDENTAAKKANEEATKAATKAAEEMNKAYFDNLDALNQSTASIVDDTQKLRDQNIELTYGKDALERVEKARTQATIATLQATLAGIDETNQCSAEAEAIRGKIAALEDYAAAQGANVIAKHIEEEGKIRVDMWKKVDDVARDTFVNIWGHGKSTLDRLRDTLKNGLLAMLYEMGKKQFLISIGVTGAGLGASGMAAASGMGGGGGGASAGSWLSGASSIYSAVNAGITTSISQGVAQVGATFWNAGAEQIGNAIMTNIAPLTAAISYLGAGMAGITLGTMIAGDKEVMGMSGQTTSTAGAVIGAIFGGPVGAAIGGAIGGVINAAFGMGPRQSGTTTLVGQFGAEGFAGQYQTPWSQQGGWFRSNRSGVDYSALGQEQVDAFAAVTEGTASVFTNLIAASGDATRSLDGWNFAINRQVATQEQQNQLVIDMAESMGNYLIPSLDSFKAEGENLADTAVRMRDEFVLTSSVAALLGQDINAAFGAIGLASMAARDNLVQLMGGIQGMNATVQSYYQNFFSDTERHALELTALTGKFAQLGQTIPETRDGYRDLIEAQDLSTESGRQMFAALMALNGEFAALVPVIEEVALATSNAAEIAKANLGWQQQIDVLQGTQTQRQVDLANALDGADASTALLINQLFGLQDAASAATIAAEAAAEAAALARTNSGIQQQIDVLQGTQTQRQVDLANALDGADASTALLITQLYGLQDAAAVAAEAQAIAQENLSTAKSDLLEAYNRESSAAQQLAERMTGFADGFNRLRTSLALGALSTLSPEAKYLEAKRQFEDVSRRAQLGDVAALGELENVSQSFLQTSREYNATSEIYARDFAAVSDALKSSAGTATRQANIAAEQVNLMQSQLAALGLINGSVLSMAVALGNYATAAAAAAAASAAPAPAPAATSAPIPGGLTPANNAGLSISSTDNAMVAAAKVLYQSATGGVPTSLYNQYVKAVGGANAIPGWTGDPQDLREYYGFAVGTNYVPHDMTANIHEGERIIPAADNRALMQTLNRSNDNAETNKLLKEEIVELRALIRQQAAGFQALLSEMAKGRDGAETNARRIRLAVA